MKNKPTLSQFFLGALLIFAIGFTVGLFLLSLLVGGAKITHAQSAPTRIIPLQVNNNYSGDAILMDFNFPYPVAIGNTFNSRQTYKDIDIDATSACFSSLQTGNTVNSNPIQRTINNAWHTSDVDCAGSGTYFYVFEITSGPALGNKYYISYNYDAAASVNDRVSITDSINDTTTIYSSINNPVPYGVTTATTSVYLNITFKASAGFDFGELPPQKIGYRIYDAVTNELETEYIDTFEPNTAYNFNYSTTLNLATGSKMMYSYIEDLNTGTKLTTDDSIFFNVVTNSYLAATGLDNPESNPTDLTQINCATFDVGCQFQKAITFLFVPSNTILDRYGGLWQQIRTKVPFGYVSAVIDQLQGLDDNATPAFDLGTLPFMNTLFTPLRDAFGVMLWGIYAIYFYRHRLTQLDI